MGNETAAASPATTPQGETGDGKKGSGNLNGAQAAALLMKSDRQARQKAAEQPKPATAETTPAAPAENAAATTPDSTPVAEAAPASSAESPAGEATPVETEQSAETGTTPEDDDPVLSPDISLSPQAKEIIRQRIAREVAKSKSMAEASAEKQRLLEAKVSELESKLTPQQQQQANTPVVIGGIPLADIADSQALQKLHDTTTAAIRFAEETLDTPQMWRTKVVPMTDPDSGEAIMDPNTGEAKVQRFKVTKVGDQEYTEPELKRLMRQWKATKEDEIPQRARFLAQRSQAQQEAFRAFPFLKDKTTPEYQQAQAARRELPWLETLPNADWIIGVQLRGLKALQEDAARAKAAADGKAKPKAATPKPSSDQAAVSATSSSARVSPGTASRNGIQAEREKQLAKRGITAQEAVASLQRVAQLRNSR